MSELDLQRQISALQARLDRLASRDEPKYAEGTWTPIFTGTGTAGTFTYANQYGYYTRIGNACLFQGLIAISNITVSPTGNMRIAGLPLTVANISGGLFPVSFGYISYLDYPGTPLQITGYATANTTYIELYYSVDNAAAVLYPAANFTNINAYLAISGWYRV